MSSTLTLFFTISVFISSVSATEYTVGGDVGWRVPAPNEAELYNVWGSRRQFYVGDSLHFRYGFDSLLIVEKYAFYHCDSSDPVAFYNEGDDVIDLYKSGPMYFISGDDEKCKQGLKMMVKVMSSGPVRQFPPPTFHPPPTFDPPPPPPTFDPPTPPPTFDPPPTFEPPPTFDPPPAFNPPEDPDPWEAPSPSDQESSPAPCPSDSVASFAVTVLIVGLGLWGCI